MNRRKSRISPKTSAVKAELANYEEFFSIAKREYQRAFELHKEVVAIGKNKRHLTDADAERIAHINDEIGRCAMVVVIFCAFVAESFINHYAIERLSGNYLKKYLDKLDTLSKWIVVPRLVKGEQINPGNKSIQDLDKLIHLRNNLAHYKTKKVEVGQIKGEDFLWYEDALFSIKTVRQLLKDLCQIDGKVNYRWTD